MADNPDILQAVIGILSADPAVAARTSGRISGDRLPQGAELPAITLWVVSGDAWNDLAGSIGIDQDRVQIDAYGENRADAAELAWYAWKALDAKLGVYSGVEIKGAERASGVRHATDRVRAGTDEYRYVASQDFRYTYCSNEKVS